jgi:hypothetical protein
LINVTIKLQNNLKKYKNLVLLLHRNTNTKKSSHNLGL